MGKVFTILLVIWLVGLLRGGADGQRGGRS